MSTPDSTPLGGPRKLRKPRGPLDAATLDQLDKDEQVILAVKQRDAGGARSSLKDQCAQVSRRRKLQLAIDAEYPPALPTPLFANSLVSRVTRR